jgi:hypothetical protein
MHCELVGQIAEGDPNTLDGTTPQKALALDVNAPRESVSQLDADKLNDRGLVLGQAAVQHGQRLEAQCWRDVRGVGHARSLAPSGVADKLRTRVAAA